MLSIDRRVRENQFGYNTVVPRKIGASAPAPFRAADDLDRIRYGPIDSERIKNPDIRSPLEASNFSSLARQPRRDSGRLRPQRKR
jgi:hypothetical protein